MVQLLWKTVWQPLKCLNVVTICPGILLPRIGPRDMKTALGGHLVTGVDDSLVPKGAKVETTPASTK